MPRLLVALASVLLAHGDTGRLELVHATAVDGTTVTNVVERSDAEDRAVISQAEIIVVTDEVAPRAMAPLGESRYEGTVEFPSSGDYPVNFTVERPAAAELVVEQLVEATTTAVTTDEPPGTTTTAARTRDEVAEDEGGAWWLLIVMGAIVAAMVVVAAAYFRGRRQPSQ